MAEALLRKIAAEERLDLEVRSAGVAAVDGLCASEQAIQVLKEKGIKHEHQSRFLEREWVEWADLILTMTYHHKQLIVQEFPEHLEKVYTLKEFASLDTRVEELHQALDRLYVEMESKRAEIQARHSLKADQKWPPEAEKDLKNEWGHLLEKEKRILSQLDRKAADLDIGDPFGGSIEVYRGCAEELEYWIRKALSKLRNA